MPDTSPASRFRTSGLARRWKFALVGLPVGLTILAAVLVVALLGQLGNIGKWTMPPERVLAANEELVLGEVQGFSVDTFHYQRPTGYVLAATAPFDTFPGRSEDDTMEDGCTTRQHEWLRANARPATDSRSSVTLVNSRTSGAPMVVKNIRAIGTQAQPEAPTVELRCFPEVAQPQPLQPGILEVGAEDIAVFAALNEAWAPGQWQESGEEQEASAPLVYVLGPGEAANLVLEYVTRSNFTGILVAAVVADGVETSVNLSSGRIFVASVVSEPDLSFLVTAGALTCRDLRGEAPAAARCSPYEAASLLAPYRRLELPKAPL